MGTVIGLPLYEKLQQNTEIFQKDHNSKLFTWKCSTFLIQKILNHLLFSLDSLLLIVFLNFNLHQVLKRKQTLLAF